MADATVDDATAGAGTGAKFNPNNPNNFAVEASYLLIPGILLVGLVVYLIYRLLASYKAKELARLEKKKKKEDRKKK